MTNYNNYKSWPFNEAKKLVKRIEKNPKKEKIIFENSLSPHIGKNGLTIVNKVVKIGQFSYISKLGVKHRIIRKCITLDINPVQAGSDYLS